MRSELFQPTVASEARVLLLIDAFTGPNRSLEGRTKLAKLDFLLRYPAFLDRALQKRVPNRHYEVPINDVDTIETRMLRYRYGPWDPAYFAVLGRLIGRGLVTPVSETRGIGYRSTDLGHEIAEKLAATDAWSSVAETTTILKRHFDLSGTTLKDFVYENFPEVTQAKWGDQL